MSDIEKLRKEYDEFVNIVAHDIAAPLRHIREFNKLLLESLGTNLSEDQMLYKNFVESAILRIQGMQEDLLTLSRITSRPTNMTEIDLGAMLGTLATENNYPLTITNTLPRIIGDAAQIATLLRIVLNNAVVYQDVVDQARITISTSIEGHNAIIHVTDNGIGIDSRFYSDIFKIFRRLHGEHAYGGGRGAGLAIAKKIAEHHGGDVRVSSSVPGQGSTFDIVLPLSLQPS